MLLWNMLFNERLSEGVEPNDAEDIDALRQQAIKQIERRRRFYLELASSGIGMVILVTVWGTSEYHNSGGWPTRGFSQSSGVPHAWNFWIIYPLIIWALFIATRAWSAFGRKPISEQEISREIDRRLHGR